MTSGRSGSRCTTTTRRSPQLDALGVSELEVAVISKNAEALRFYERQGLVPFTVTYLGPVKRQG
jgi:hypothetical protein